MSKQKSEKSFWEAVNESAELARSSPSWMKAGINLSEKNFVTYRGDASTLSPERSISPEPSEGK
jgi:hypothetical protein